MYTQDEIDRLALNQLLGLGVDYKEDALYNILMDKRKGLVYEDPASEILSVMSNPENFWYTCKYIFNTNIFPFQLLILNELWKRKFPMLIGCRGLGKCVAGNTLVQFNHRFMEIGTYIGYESDLCKQIESHDQVINEGGTYSDIEYGWNNGVQKCRKITTADGFTLIGTLNHPIRILRDGKLEWVELQDVKLDDEAVLALGGEWHSGHLEIEDSDCVKLGKELYNNFPSIMYKASKSQMAKFLRALLEQKTHFSFGNRRMVTIIHKNVSPIIQIILLKYGVKSRVAGGTDKQIVYLTIEGDSLDAYRQEILGEKNLRPHFPAYTTSKVVGIGSELKQTFDVHLKTEDHSFVSNGFVSHNSWILALYSLLRATFDQGSKVIVVGGGFRQSKIIFDYIEKFWNKSEIFRDMLGNGKSQGPHHEMDRYSFGVGESEIIAVPIGDGCLRGDTHITTTNGFTTIKLAGKYGVWGNRRFRYTAAFLDNGVKPTKRVRTSMGYEFESTYNHKMKILRGGAVVWERADQLKVGDSILIDISKRWHDGQSDLTEEAAYKLGKDFKGDLPSNLLTATQPIMTSFLTALFSTGQIQKEGDNIKNTIDLEESTAAHIQYILLHYGVVSKRVGGRLTISGPSALIFSDGMACDYIPHFPAYIFYDEIKSIENSQSHTYDIEVPDGNEYCANGFFSHNSKIRGLRATHTISDEFGSMNPEIFEVIIRGFSSVQSEPFDKAIKESKIDVLKSLNMYKENYGDEGIGNQIVISGTATYSFNHFYTYYQRYKAIVESGGDTKRLEELFAGPVPEDFNWKDFSVLRIPYNKLPRGFLDMGQIAQAKATTHKSIVQMEYGACEAPGTPIITHRGIRPIESLRVGDLVLTHKGRFRPITKLTYRQYDGDVNVYNTDGYCKTITTTIDHPFWEGEDSFKRFNGQTVKRANLQTLYNIHSITTDDINLPKTIDLSYDLGLVVGYYVGTKKTNIVIDNFGLQRLLDAFKSVFNVIPQIRIKNNINELILDSNMVRLLKTIYFNIIDHKLIYSNERFLRGFITGIWKSIPDRPEHIIYKNNDIISQLQIGLSYFGIDTYLFGRNSKLSIVDVDKFNELVSDKDFIFTPKPYTEYKVERHKVKKYSGLVYNMEVADDNSYSKPNCTVHNCFAVDSDGFFKRSIIESCVTKEPILVDSGPVSFAATLKGNQASNYVIGIDPASERDNFAMVVLEVFPDHKRIVYAWSINRQRMRARMTGINADEVNRSFYSYCARKIREVAKLFPTTHIGIDGQGGGIAIIEALHDPIELRVNEQPIWPYIRRGSDDPMFWELANKPTDGEPGQHILHVVQFANPEFTARGNHMLRRDFESKLTLFPYFDSVTVAESVELDALHHREYDTLEDCVFEIEELKDELASIVHTQTANGRDRWDTPEIKLPGNKKGRLRKDRYSALVIANLIADLLDVHSYKEPYKSMGGFVGQGTKKHSGNMYNGPQHLIEPLNKLVYKGVSRGV